jgi:predicted nucleotidyltransferase component of viral defense system
MLNFANQEAAERAAFFRECAARRGISSPVIIEKDFWVCWALGLLFGLEAPPRLLFKGGTSLSKGYALIDRFSEDVDLALDRADLGFVGDRDPAKISGTKARQRALEDYGADHR